MEELFPGGIPKNMNTCRAFLLYSPDSPEEILLKSSAQRDRLGCCWFSGSQEGAEDARTQCSIALFGNLEKRGYLERKEQKHLVPLMHNHEAVCLQLDLASFSKGKETHFAIEVEVFVNTFDWKLLLK